jgi:hypothetical protein
MSKELLNLVTLLKPKWLVSAVSKLMPERDMTI